MATDPMVVFGRGQCTECGTNLIVIDIESTFLELDDDGTPKNETTIIKIKAKCPHCKRDYEMLRDGLSYIFDNDLNRIQMRYKTFLEHERMKKIMDEQRMPNNLRDALFKKKE